VVVSFWVKSNQTGKFPLILSDTGNAVDIGKLYEINSANTWEYKTIAIEAPTIGTFDADNTTGIVIYWGFGSTSSTRTAQGTTWGASNTSGSSKAMVTGASTALATTNGATWQITGVQLEVGKVATPFEHRSYGEELALCQRYFQSVYDSALSAIAAGRGASGGDAVVVAIPIPVALRASPAVASSGVYYVYDHNSRISSTPNSVTVSNYPTNGSVIALYLAFPGIVCDDDRVNLISSLGATTLTLDAEL